MTASEGYDEYIEGSPTHRGNIIITSLFMGDIMSTLGDVQYIVGMS